MTSAISATMPTPAPIPALAAVESPDGEDAVSFAFGFEFAVGVVFAGVVAEEARDPEVMLEAVLVVKTPATVPNNYANISMRMLSDWISATYANT
jgi:hypothetical protein